MNVFEDAYVGNESVLEKLLSAIDAGGVTAFTGAGTSMPQMPGWGSLVHDLVEEAAMKGMIERATATALSESSDFLYVIDEVYSAAGEGQTKAKVCEIFSSLRSSTDAHNLVVGTKFDRFMTLNYDQGLEMAFASQYSAHSASITPQQSNELDLWIRGSANLTKTFILHWHGLASDAKSIVLSGSDYIKFYEAISSHKETLRNIFNTKRVLMIGFGFSDPFIESELNSVMQPLPKANSHFAIIGIPENAGKNIALERRRYASKYKLEAIFYPVKKKDTGSDHSALISVLEIIKNSRPRPVENITTSPPSEIIFAPQEKNTYRSNLFTIGNQQIYFEPNLYRHEGGQGSEGKISLSEITSSHVHYSIHAPSEYGLTNVGRRLAWELEASEKKAIFRDAQIFPKYKKAILSDPDFSKIRNDENFTLILDNFSVLEHQRILKELTATFSNIRIIILQRSHFAETLDDSLESFDFQALQLHGLSRGNIRDAINTITPDYNSDIKSTIVDKVYHDLLQLCIPLTPSNVIMYSSVLCKDGNFSPISRLHIVEKFTSQALARASDAYSDTFNSVNKLDLIAEFCFNLFAKDTANFTKSEWNSFCEKFVDDNLVQFNKSEILGDLINGRIIFQDGQIFHFRYKMFFSYFVGRHISSRPSLLKDCLLQNRHLELDGLIEVLCGTLYDSSEILDDLTNKLSGALTEFYENYPISGLDCHENVRWEIKASDRELWNSVSDRLESGPVSSQELDELKTSIQAERRTIDQKVSIIKFITSEKSVAAISIFLHTALESVKHAQASSKKAAAIAVIKGHTLAYEVATVFVPLISERKYVSWNGFTYVNLMDNTESESESDDPNYIKQKRQNQIAYALPFSTGRSAADAFGSRKLGQVFLALIEDSELNTPIKRYFLFCLLIRSKPVGWLAMAKRMISNAKREDIYLQHMLYMSLKQFKHEINTEAERKDLKELVASIRLRREANVKIPSSTELRKTIGKLDNSGYWDEDNSKSAES